MTFSQSSSFYSNTNESSLSQQLEIVWGYIDTQNVDKAIIACKQVNRAYENSAEGWFATSFLAFQLRNSQQALSAIEKAISLEPKNLKWQAHKGHSLLLSGDKKSALSLMNLLINSFPPATVDDHHLSAEIALIFNKLGDYQTSINYYQQAINLAPSSAELYFNLASVQRYLGQISEAEVNLNWAISLNPHDYEAYLQRASLRKQTNEDNHVEQLTSLLDKGIAQPIGKAQICYALAKEHEDLQQYPQSFSALNQGAKTRRDHMNYQVNNDLDTLKKLTTVFTKDFFTQQNSVKEVDTNDQAIFVLGLPRTGSTLIERIISSHSEVNSAGELNDFALQMMAQVQNTSKTAPKSRLELIELTRQLDFKALGNAYLKSTEEHAKENKKFIDKLPLNSLYVGLIHLALPNAKIIHVKRNPLDTIYAMYKQLFTNGYPFSYDLTELTNYYIAHHQLMEHWHHVLPNVIHQVSYESVLSDVTRQAKNLIKFCQLPWQPQCSDFHQNQAPSTTASASQVREKLYTSSANKWQHYQQQLSNVQQQLELAGIKTHCELTR